MTTSSEPDRPSPPRLTIATFNLLNDLSQWDRRSTLACDGLREVSADVLAFQEVNLSIDNARWLADSLGGYEAHVASGTGRRQDREGLAILTRFPSSDHETLPFGKQGRIAQRITVHHGGVDWTIANVHLHFSLYDDDTRRTQARELLQWLPEGIGPTVVCGDFNAQPGYRAVATMLERFASAQFAHYGREQHATFPTALDRGPSARNRSRAVGLRLLGRAMGQPGAHWQGTLDYIFVDRRLRVLRCDVALHLPSSDDPSLYASDHVALVADLEWPHGA